MIAIFMDSPFGCLQAEQNVFHPSKQILLMHSILALYWDQIFMSILFEISRYSSRMSYEKSAILNQESCIYPP